jgi:hypothetical protein
MSDFDLFAAPQGRCAVPRRLNIAASADASAQVGTQSRKSINLLDSADFCRPHS